MQKFTKITEYLIKVIQIYTQMFFSNSNFSNISFSNNGQINTIQKVELIFNAGFKLIKM